MREYDILVLGAGWTGTFLLPLLKTTSLLFAATTRDGRDVEGFKTIKWSFDDNGDFTALPLARHVLITFPLNGSGESKGLVNGYKAAFSGHVADSVRFIQLGSSSIWQGVEQKDHWITRHSPHNRTGSRAVAEDELLALGGCVLNLSGLWGGERMPRNWIDRVTKTKEDVEGKKSLHMVHGLDVARSIVALIQRDKWEELGKGQRWMLTDGFVYDWWSLLVGWADVKEDEKPTKQAKWVFELMVEHNVRALPRSMEALGRCYDSREFWNSFGLQPLRARI
ncbi:hypothetical protein K470DRAFT_268082 [Piedraia hortae CBS 480.64]|uniref:NAD(P)-binding protein n=1 Tax=Piedraia hortae CBS 480.64 TaxID=1314780 RepID=A0A6A7C7W0_9PEZI|nr:hypothetical protein K470DRAFT_268082 [Piedraia hortae CBS 480.64]